MQKVYILDPKHLGLGIYAERQRAIELACGEVGCAVLGVSTSAMRAWSGAQFDNSTFKLSESGDADVRRPAVKRREKRLG